MHVAAEHQAIYTRKYRVLVNAFYRPQNSLGILCVQPNRSIQHGQSMNTLASQLELENSAGTHGCHGIGNSHMTSKAGCKSVRLYRPPDLPAWTPLQSQGAFSKSQKCWGDLFRINVHANSHRQASMPLTPEIIAKVHCVLCRTQPGLSYLFTCPDLKTLIC